MELASLALIIIHLFLIILLTELASLALIILLYITGWGTYLTSPTYIFIFVLDRVFLSQLCCDYYLLTLSLYNIYTG